MTEQYQLTIRALPDRVPAVARLKAFLKTAKRRWNFQCIEARALPAAEGENIEQKDKCK